ncbi:hypothetical protein [Desulfofundulus thermobenzoicus]|nr:hypothetical protein [Desulfofundulus thermobenzoicus]
MGWKDLENKVKDMKKQTEQIRDAETDQTDTSRENEPPPEC